MEYSKILKGVLITPVMISKEFNLFKKSAINDTIQLVSYLDKQYIEFEIRQSKMKKINRFINDVNRFSF